MNIFLPALGRQRGRVLTQRRGSARAFAWNYNKNFKLFLYLMMTLQNCKLSVFIFFANSTKNPDA